MTSKKFSEKIWLSSNGSFFSLPKRERERERQRSKRRKKKTKKVKGPSLEA